jgi:hypothetical protein
MKEVSIVFTSALGLEIQVTATSVKLGNWMSVRGQAPAEITPEQLREAATEVERARDLVAVAER